MNIGELNDTALALVAPGKGILAADESTNTIKRRFDSIDVESTEQSRRDYREMLFRTAGVNEFISGVILYDETLRQRGADGTPIVSILQERGIIPGIKVDKSTNPLANTDGELITDGIDGLRDRLAEYHAIGARFSKWRAVITIGDGIPSQYCIDANAHMLGRFAALSQEAGLVPIVEPETLMDGDHPIERCYEVTLEALRSTYAELARQRVDLRGTLLKPNMVISGKDAAERADANEVAGAHARLPNARRPRRRAGHRLPQRRPERRRGYRKPARHQLRRPRHERAMGTQLLLWTRLAGCPAEGMGGQRRQRRIRSVRSSIAAQNSPPPPAAASRPAHRLHCRTGHPVSMISRERTPLVRTTQFLIPNS